MHSEFPPANIMTHDIINAAIEIGVRLNRREQRKQRFESQYNRYSLLSPFPSVQLLSNF